MTGTTCKQAGDQTDGWADRARHLGLRGLEVVGGDVPGLLVGALHVESELHGTVGAEVGAGAVSEKREVTEYGRRAKYWILQELPHRRCLENTSKKK